MNKAIDEETLEVINASDFHLIKDLQSRKYRCISPKCHVPVVPSAFRNGSKQAPHFRKHKGFEHSPECEYALDNSIYEKGLNGQKLSNNELNRIGYPSLFNIKLEKEIENSNLDNEKEGVNVVGSSKPTTNNSNKEFSTFRGNTVTAIDRIVDFYLGFPANRDSTITINGKAISYNNLFKQILSNKKYEGNTDTFLFAKVLVSKSEKQDNTYKIDRNKNILKLFPADFVDNDVTKINRYELIMNKTNISKQKLTRIHNNFQTEFSKRITLKEKGKDLYVFFIGSTPSKTNEIKFNLTNDYICFRYTDIRSSNTSNDL